MSGVRLSSPCIFCKHFRGKSTLPRQCEAFPEQIPNEIWVAKVDHRKPYKDDNGIQFEFQKDTSLLPYPLEDELLASVKKIYKMSIWRFENIEQSDE